MARLLFLGDPVIAANKPGAALGHCVTVLPDGFALSKDNASRFIVVDTDMPQSECEDLWLADGVDPQIEKDLLDAEAAALKADMDLAAKDPEKDFLVYASYVKARDDTRDAWEAAENARQQAQRARPRAVALDLAVVPQENLDAPTAIRAAIDAVKVDAKAAAKSALLSVIEAAFGVVNQATIDTESKDIIESLSARAASAKAQGSELAVATIDALKDELIEASRLGREHVEAPVFDAFPVPKPVFLDAAALAAAAVPA